MITAKSQFTLSRAIFALSLYTLLFACKKKGCTDTAAENYNPKAKQDDGTCTYAEPQLIFVFDFDTSQIRLDNFGNPTELPNGHAGQHPKMNGMSAHYLELAPNAFTPLGSGVILYHAPETQAGGSVAIDFSKAVVRNKNQPFLTIPLKSIPVGDYEFLRVSLGYQNYDVVFHYDSIHTVPGFGDVHVIQDFPATVASFVGFESYIESFVIKTQSVHVNANKKQGFWGFETSGTISALNNFPFSFVESGQAPEGATTVVNPINSTSPIPAGSCVVTGAFPSGKLMITGTETTDIVIRVSLSTNRSFEWIDANGNNKWEPTKGETIVDMGLRGLVPYIE